MNSTEIRNEIAAQQETIAKIASSMKLDDATITKHRNAKDRIELLTQHLRIAEESEQMSAAERLREEQNAAARAFKTHASFAALLDGPASRARKAVEALQAAIAEYDGACVALKEARAKYIPECQRVGAPFEVPAAGFEQTCREHLGNFVAMRPVDGPADVYHFDYLNLVALDK